MRDNTVIEHPDPALEEAVSILENADEAVISSMMDILNSTSQETSNWDGNHTTSALKILSAHVSSLHKSKVLELETEERASRSKLIPYLTGIGFAGTLALSWLFLEFDKPEYILAILSGLFGFVGGYGASHAKKWKSQL